ncbi:septum formation inhibitor Maf [Thiohalocapsa halophila]|uniref:7-methyl-GTP pyrophosphatase n=1 Tax=Thiohalocapsa halophila TaxID=69359 RepID=A0ABS1CP90_9GAMM|nr:nucleoside triphosphate pyrophosphatase [Thiohalocapsa halophila]MBK1633742.1 septum formation inhibitor Maf [Thiohalocapsa halophila]
MTRPRLVLASTSPFRRELLARLGLPFDIAAPDVDEAQRPGEGAKGLVLRLAESKARAVADQFPDALVIGSDQVAGLADEPDGAILGKPGTRERAIEQLTRASGRTVVFRTGLCLLRTADARVQTACELFKVHFRTLTKAQIEAYIDREQPLGCAGSFKSEGLGITLFERLEGDDPNALIGLPLIRLVDMLAAAGVEVLGARA